MFIIKSSRNDYLYMNCHSDDVELLTTSPTDASEVIEKFQNQYGVKMADSSYMLGLNRDEITVDGVKTIQITQDAYMDKRISQAYLSLLPEQVSKNKCSGNGHK